VFKKQVSVGAEISNDVLESYIRDNVQLHVKSLLSNRLSDRSTLFASGGSLKHLIHVFPGQFAIDQVGPSQTTHHSCHTSQSGDSARLKNVDTSYCSSPNHAQGIRHKNGETTHDDGT
jgi:hypothetical protein